MDSPYIDGVFGTSFHSLENTPCLKHSQAL